MTSNNRVNHRYSLACVGLLGAACLVGCNDGPFKFADVSGVVTLDGQPLADAMVRFNPKRSGDSPMVGPSSFAVTDAEGRFDLKTHQGNYGAVVGPHVVSVSTYAAEPVDLQNSDEIRVLSKERVPKRYRSPSELTIDVPSGGVDDASFELTSS